VIPAPILSLFPPGPYVLVEDPKRHVMRITTVRDWGDGRGPVPLLASIVEWSNPRIKDPQGRPSGWREFKPSDVAYAHKILALLNHDWECKK
jgi:hypothetical protein